LLSGVSNVRNALCLLGLLIAVQFCTGCATIVTGGGADQAVRFASTPRGADVYVDGNKVGQTPVSVRLTRKDEHQVRIVKEGFTPYEKTIESGLNPWLFGNIILGGLIGLGVDVLSGTNPSLKTTSINAPMKADPAYAQGTGVASPTLASYTTSPPPRYAAPPPPQPVVAPAPTHTTYMNVTPPPAPAYTAPPPPPAPVYRPAPAPTPVYSAPAPAVAPQPARSVAQPAPAAPYKGW
jgi:hypothetical protein